MALSETQKVTIEQSVAHLIDPPTDAKEFSDFEKNLFDRFTGQESTNEEITQLWSCFNDPTTYFKNLENLGPNITIGEVKTYLLNFITSTLEATHITLTTWQPQVILAKYNSDTNWNEPFITKKQPQEDTYNPLLLPTSDEMIFNGQIGFDEGTLIDDQTHEAIKILWPYVNVTLSLPDAEPVTTKLRFNTPIFQADLGVTIDGQAYLSAALSEGYSIAATYACTKAVEFAANKGIEIGLNNDDPDAVMDHTLELSTPVCILLTNKYYLAQVLYGSITFSHLHSLSLNQAMILTNKALIDCAASHLPGLSIPELITYSPEFLSILSNTNVLELIKREQLSISDAKLLTTAQLKMISHPAYYAKIIGGQLPIKTILSLQPAEIGLYMIPIVSNMIQNDKLTCEQVRHWPLYLKTIIADTRFDELINRNKVDFHQLEKLSENHARLLKIKTIFQKFISDDLSLIEITEIPDEKLRLIFNCPLLTKWLESGMISYNELKQFSLDEPSTLYIKGMVNSLFNVTPAQYNKITINETWINELKTASQACGIAFAQFMSLFSYALGSEIRDFLNHSTVDTDTHTFDPWLLRLNVLLNTRLEQTTTYWVSFYDEASQYAQMLSKTIRAKRYTEASKDQPPSSLTTSLFPRQDKSRKETFTDRLQLACDTLEKMAQLTAAVMNQRMEHPMSVTPH